jgi:hypothetical protein
MKRLATLSLVVSILAALSCSHVQGSEGSGEKGDPLTGTWVGDFGPAFYDRNTISIDLKWDGQKLTGMVVPGVPGGRMYRDFQGFPIENASFDPATGIVKFEATYKPRNRHYIIQGKVSQNSLSGTWSRPEDRTDGDFKLTRKAT